MANNRRDFLKNTALAAAGLGLTSSLSAKCKLETKTTSLLDCDATTLDFYGAGPFYTENPPLLTDNKLAEDTEPGDKMIISGRVFNLDCSEFIPDTIIDVWHANDAGQYDNSGYNLRGYTKTNEQGFYLFETIKPGKYLNGASFRPSHIHYKITPPNFPELITQLYFEGDTDIPGDAAASITSGTYDASNRIIPLTANADGVYEGTFDIILNGEGLPVGVNDLHLNNGMIYKASPNPFVDELEIYYGLFKKAKVGIEVFNLAGKQVAILEDSVKAPEKYYAYWRPEQALPSGHYFVALKVNDLQVHYLKVVKQ